MSGPMRLSSFGCLAGLTLLLGFEQRGEPR